MVEARCGAQISRLLIDCGLSVKELSKRLAQADLKLEDLDAVFVTHEHADHIGHTQQLAKRTDVPLWPVAFWTGACPMSNSDLSKMVKP